MNPFRTLTAICLISLLSAGTFAQTTMPLWEGNVPGAKGKAKQDTPTITVYKPENPDQAHAAFIICPGGGYGGLCSSYEGHDIAKWLKPMGIVGIVLKYRVAPYRHPIPLTDAKRAMRIVRYHAREWGIDPTRIGIMGFSAGGHLASTLGTHFDFGDLNASDPLDRVSSRPDFMVLVYPVITMMPEFSHKGSRRNLLGENPSEDTIRCTSNELQITKATPPTFLAHSIQDRTVPVENSRLFARAMKEKCLSVRLFELPKGAHGLGAGKGECWKSWQTACEQWLKDNHLTNSTK